MGKDLTAEGIKAEKKQQAAETFDRLHKDGANRFGMEWLRAHMVVSSVVDEEYVSEDAWGGATMEVKAVVADTVFRLLERYRLMPRSATGESLRFLIGEFMNLVQACEMKGVKFEHVDGIDLSNSREVINDYLKQLGYDDKRIAAYWSGEEQLTSS